MPTTAKTAPATTQRHDAPRLIGHPQLWATFTHHRRSGRAPTVGHLRESEVVPAEPEDRRDVHVDPADRAVPDRPDGGERRLEGPDDRGRDGLRNVDDRVHAERRRVFDIEL